MNGEASEEAFVVTLFIGIVADWNWFNDGEDGVKGEFCCCAQKS